MSETHKRIWLFGTRMTITTTHCDFGPSLKLYTRWDLRPYATHAHHNLSKYYIHMNDIRRPSDIFINVIVLVKKKDLYIWECIHLWEKHRALVIYCENPFWMWNDFGFVVFFFVLCDHSIRPLWRFKLLECRSTHNTQSCIHTDADIICIFSRPHFFLSMSI